MSSNTETQVLLQRWQRGDREALGKLIDRSRPWITAAARQQLGPRLRGKHDTQDIVQESLLELLAYKPASEVKTGAQFAGLLRKIIENVVVGRFAWFKRKRRDMGREAPLPDHSRVILDPSLKDVTQPDVAASREESRAVIRLALGLLAPEDRDVILRRHFEGQGFAAIGEAIGTSADGARKRFDRAMPKLFAMVRRLSESAGGEAFSRVEGEL